MEEQNYPIQIEFDGNKPVSVKVDLDAWLEAILDTEDPVAQAYQQLLEWLHVWIEWRSWNHATMNFGKLLNNITGEGVQTFVETSVAGWDWWGFPRDASFTGHDLESARAWWARQAIVDFPVGAMATIAEAGIDLEEVYVGDGRLTERGQYNFTEHLAWTPIEPEDGGGFCPDYVIYSLGTSADSYPTVGKVRDPDYWYPNSVEYHCGVCESDFENDQIYGLAIDRSDYYPSVVNAEEVERLRVRLDPIRKYQAGQQVLPGVEPYEPDPIAEAIIAAWEELDDEEDEVEIWAFIEKDDGSKYPKIDHLNETIPSWRVWLWCPECGGYEVWISHPVEGW